MPAPPPIPGSEQTFRLLVSSVRDYGIFHLDPDGRIASWNEGARLIKGYEASEVIGKHFSLFYPPEDIAAGKPEMELREATRVGRFEDEGWRLRKDGSRFWANVVITALRAEDGTLLGFAKVTRDLTVRRQAEEVRERLASEKAARAAAEHTLARLARLQAVTAAYSEAVTPEAVGHAAVQHVTGLLGAFGAALFLREEEEQVLSVLDQTGFGPAQQQKYGRIPLGDSNPFAAVVRTGLSLYFSSFDDVQQRFPGFPSLQGRQTEAAALLALAVKGRTLGVLLVSFAQRREFDPDDRAFLDVFAQHTAQALDRARLFREAQDAVKLRDDFLTVASHELRTPLTALDLVIDGLVRASQGGDGPRVSDPSVRRRLQNVVRQSQRLKELVEDLLNVTRISQGRLQLQPARLDLGELVREVADRFVESARQHGVELKVDAPPGVSGEWDRQRLDQVLANLVDNALKYGEGKPVEISVTRTDHEAVVTVRDHGRGIATEDQDRIFERFERAAPVRNYGGLGLGLWISRQLTEAHGGHLRVTSAPGEGSTFQLVLPFSAADVTRADPESA